MIRLISARKGWMVTRGRGAIVRRMIMMIGGGDMAITHMIAISDPSERWRIRPTARDCPSRSHFCTDYSRTCVRGEYLWHHSRVWNLDPGPISGPSLWDPDQSRPAGPSLRPMAARGPALSLTFERSVWSSLETRDRIEGSLLHEKRRANSPWNLEANRANRHGQASASGRRDGRRSDILGELYSRLHIQSRALVEWRLVAFLDRYDDLSHRMGQSSSRHSPAVCSRARTFCFSTVASDMQSKGESVGPAGERDSARGEGKAEEERVVPCRKGYILTLMGDDIINRNKGILIRLATAGSGKIILKRRGGLREGPFGVTLVSRHKWG